MSKYVDSDQNGRDDNSDLRQAAHIAKYPQDNPIAGANTDRQVVISPGARRTVGRPGSPQTVTSAPNMLGVSEAKNLFNGQLLANNAGAMSIADYMFRSGIISLDPKTRAGKNAASKAYNQAVDDTADINQAGMLGTTVMDMLSEIKYSTGPSGSGSGKSTFKQYSTYTKEQARKKAVDAYKAVLGRSPSEKEISEFTNGLMKAAKAEPSIQKTKGGGSSTSQETTQGFSEKDWTLGYLSAKIPTDVDLQGASGVAQDMVAALTEQYGIKLSSSLAYDSVRDIIQGKTDANGLEQVFKEQAKILFPHLSDKIDAGLNPRKIADAYISNTVNILEKNPIEVDLFNQNVKQALTYKDAAGNYALPTSDEHARMLREKPEWLDTRNGKETLMRAADNILRQMGFE